MHVQRTVTIAVIGGAFATWLAAAATSNHVVPPPPIVRTPAIDKSGAELAVEIERLHDRLRPDASPAEPGRNLFAFRAAPIRRAPALPAALMPALSEAKPLAPALPPMKLSGIAEDPGPDGPVRMAFISAEGQFFMVKEGESVTPRYRVARIGEDVVELSDETDHSIRRLAMR
jgi:hypothetical protein